MIQWDSCIEYFWECLLLKFTFTCLQLSLTLLVHRPNEHASENKCVKINTERAKKFTSGSRDVDRHSEVREYRKLVKHACNVSGNAPTGLQVRSMHQSFVGLWCYLTEVIMWRRGEPWDTYPEFRWSRYLNLLSESIKNAMRCRLKTFGSFEVNCYMHCLKMNSCWAGVRGPVK